MFPRQSNEMNNRTIGACRVEGFPVPVVGLISPHSMTDGRYTLYIGRSTLMHVRPAEVASGHVTFTQFHRAHAYSDVGKALEVALPAAEPVGLFLFLAASDDCLRAKLGRRADVAQATGIVVNAYRDLREQVALANAAGAH